MIKCVKLNGCSKCNRELIKYQPQSLEVYKNESIQISSTLTQHFGEHIKMGTRRCTFISPSKFVESIINMISRIDSIKKIIKTFNVSHEIASLTFQWILKLREKYDTELDLEIHDNPTLDMESEDDSDETDNSDNTSESDSEIESE